MKHLVTLLVLFLTLGGRASADDKPIRAGMVGLDTSHVVAFTRILNDPTSPPELSGVTVTVAYPGGSPRFAASRDRVTGFTKQLSDMGVLIVDSLDELLKRCDVVLLESVDGSQHLEQVEAIFKAGKPVFIDKPLAGSLADALRIRDLGRQHKARWFSSSSLRYQPKLAEVLANDKLGKVVGVDTFGPASIAPNHMDLAFYGIHGIEPLYALMGPGCQSVTRVQTRSTEQVTGRWKDGRVGTYRGTKEGAGTYGATVIGARGVQQVTLGGDYKPLLAEVVKFFKTGKPPLNEDETVEIFAFMEAADASKRQGGVPVTLASVIEEARKPLTFTTKVETVLKHDDGKWLWYHPRAVAVPGVGRSGQPSVFLTFQKHLAASDHYTGLSVLRSDDLGDTWEKVETPAELGWTKESDTVDVAVADVTPGWHPQSNKVLAVGAQVRYDKAGKQLADRPRSNQTAYAVMDPRTGKWTAWKRLEMPQDKKFEYARSACAQWLVRADGTVLLPFYFGASDSEPWSVTVVQCSFDGQELKYLRHGTELTLKEDRGLAEPSLAEHHGRYFLTIRSDKRGHVTSSMDGLKFDPMKEWKFDDGKELGSYNTQQHWLSHGEGLFLVYTRRGADNDHVMRHRAPLFIAQVDTEKLQVLRKTEQVLIRERGAEMGNFGATAITENESWVTVAEGLWNEESRKRGAEGAVLLARVRWSKPNKLALVK